MELELQIEYWLESSLEDLITARDMLKIKRYNWALFIGHLSLEKTLKAHYIKKFIQAPPKTYNLLYFIDKIVIPIDKEQYEFLLKVNSYNIQARYPEYKYEFDKICTLNYAEENLSKIEDFYQWIKINLK